MCLDRPNIWWLLALCASNSVLILSSHSTCKTILRLSDRWLSKTKTKVITQANHRDWEKTVQPIGSQSNSRLVLRLVLLSNQQCEYTPSLAWEVFGFGFGFVSDWLSMLTNSCGPIRKRSKRKTKAITQLLSTVIRKPLYLVAHYFNVP